MRAAGRRSEAYKLLMRTHSGNFSTSIDRRIEEELRDATTRERRGESTGLWQAYDEAIAAAAATFRADAKPDPRRLIGSRILVVKRAHDRERGVIVVDYSYVFPLLPALFNLEAITQRYHLVLEPSWVGIGAPEVLLFTRMKTPVFVETFEPHDHRLIARLDANLRVLPMAANYWVDYRPIVNQPVRQRDIDVIMVAAWTAVKRHWRFFRALAALRKRGHRLRVALVGYAYDLSAADIRAQAAYFGVEDQIEFFERISQEDVSALLTRSKVHVLWSLRESSNRAIIEAMLADVPVIVREGLTYGCRYRHINSMTGRFVTEDDLADSILEMIEARGTYAPREWVLEHMTPQIATKMVEAGIADEARASGEPWSEGLTTKVSMLDTQRYWEPSDRERFAADYQFLEAMIRR